uniref:Uncharacterized protein n=1 Tax=Arundo donax TaxID=35708 RepID=A0A0A9AHB2_ARUDO
MLLGFLCLKDLSFWELLFGN